MWGLALLQLVNFSCCFTTLSEGGSPVKNKLRSVMCYAHIRICVSLSITGYVEVQHWLLVSCLHCAVC
jgi:hypothetical protein